MLGSSAARGRGMPSKRVKTPTEQKRHVSITEQGRVQEMFGEEGVGGVEVSCRL